MKRNCLLVFAILCVSSLVVHARPIQTPDPAQMEMNASVICNGIVESVDPTGRKFRFHDAVTNPDTFMTGMRARIKLLHAFKGNPPSEFVLFYDVLDESKYPGGGIADGPERIFLQKGTRFRFFLKPDNKPGAYRNILDGAVDDAFAVERLEPHEANDHSYLKREEAIKIARNYILSIVPKATFDGTTVANRDQEGWSVFMRQDNTPSSPYSWIAVRGDGTVDMQNAKILDSP
jgi:hypothetical protein